MPTTNGNYNGDDLDNSNPSTILTTRFGFASAKLIHSVEKNLYLVMAVIVSIAILSILNILGILDYLYSDDVDYHVDLILSIILVAVLAPLLILIIKSRRVLDKWNDMFERNTIATSMSIVMANRSKEEALKSLTQSVGQISQPLREYMETKEFNPSQFIDLSINKEIKFDVLMSSDILQDSDLKEVLEEFGTIVIKIVEGTVYKTTVELFVRALNTYVSLTKSRIGLALIIGEEISEDAHQYANSVSNKRNKIDQLILISKPSLPPGDQFSVSTPFT